MLLNGSNFALSHHDDTETLKNFFLSFQVMSRGRGFCYTLCNTQNIPHSHTPPPKNSVQNVYNVVFEKTFLGKLHKLTQIFAHL